MAAAMGRIEAEATTSWKAVLARLQETKAKTSSSRQKVRRKQIGAGSDGPIYSNDVESEEQEWQEVNRALRGRYDYELDRHDCEALLLE